MAAADAVNLYGDSTSSDELNYYYTDGTYSMQVSFFNDAISSIWISDSSLD
jgi:hypothetical protein